MKLITEIQSLQNINKYDVDGIIFSYHDFSTISKTTFSISEIKEIVMYCQSHGCLSILKIDKIIEEIEVNKLNHFLEEMLLLNIDFFIFTDMSVLNFFMKKNKTNQLIYSAKTLNCSYQDSLFYHNLGIKVMLSNELTIEDIRAISELDNIVIDGYGYSNIFYSKRKLLSLFKEHRNLIDDFDQKPFFIQEEKRTENYPIIENKQGTFVFTSYKYIFYKELKLLKNLFMFKIESLLIEEEQLFKVIAIFRKALTYGINDEDYQKLIAIDNNVGHSFLYKKPLILKGQNDEKN